MNNVTQILSEIASGDPNAAEELLPLVYTELRRLARARLSHENPGQTLQATELVHEAYLRLVSGNDGVQWESRGHFFAAAAEAMRRILVEQARRKRRVRHGGGWERVSMHELPAPGSGVNADILSLDEALTKLAGVDAEKAELVKLRYFAGMTIPEAAQVLRISHATAERHWAFARAWLFNELNGS